jgi:hypothetical protein
MKDGNAYKAAASSLVMQYRVERAARNIGRVALTFLVLWIVASIATTILPIPPVS